MTRAGVGLVELAGGLQPRGLQLEGRQAHLAKAAAQLCQPALVGQRARLGHSAEEVATIGGQSRRRLASFQRKLEVGDVAVRLDLHQIACLA